MNVPKLRFKEFDGEWEERNIGGLLEDNIILNQSDGNHGELYPKKSEFQNSGIPYLSASNIKENTLEYSDLKYLSLDRAKKFKKGVANDGDVLLAHNATVGPSVLLKTKYPFVILSTTLTLYRLNKEKMDNLFFSNILRSDNVQFQLKRMMKQTTRNQVPILAQRKINIHYPCNTKEQKKIGEFFGIIDKKIQLQQQKIDLLQEQKKGFLQKMFPKNGETVPELRFDGFTGDWKEQKLREIGKTQSGIGFPDVEQGGSEGVPFFKVSDMNIAGNEYEMITSNNYVSDEQLKRKKWRPIETVPAVIFAKVGAAIMLNRKRLVRTPFLIDNNTMAYVFDESWDTDFGKILFETVNLPKYAQVGALPSYNGSDIENIEVKVTNKDEQVKIGLFFNRLEHIINLHQHKLDLLEKQKKGFMQQMFI